MHSLFLAPESIAQCIAQISENSVREVSVEDFNELFASRRREIGFTIRSNDVEIVAQVRKFEEKAVERELEAPVTLDTVRPRIFEVPEFKGMMESVIVVRIDDRKAKARWEIPEWDRYCGSSSRTRGVVFAEQPNLKCIFEEGSFGERWLYVFVDEPKMSTLELRELAISISGTDFVRDPAMKWSLDPDLKQIYLFFLGRRALDK